MFALIACGKHVNQTQQKSLSPLAVHLWWGHCTEFKHMVHIFHCHKKSIFLGNSFMQHNVLNPSNGSINPISSWNKFVFAIFQTKFKYFLIQNQVLSVRKTTLKWNEPCAWIQCNDPSQVDSQWTETLLLGLIDMFSTCNKGTHACQSNLTWSLRGEVVTVV